MLLLSQKAIKITTRLSRSQKKVKNTVLTSQRPGMYLLPVCSFVHSVIKTVECAELAALSQKTLGTNELIFYGINGRAIQIRTN